jgi:hypothetical protein
LTMVIYNFQAHWNLPGISKSCEALSNSAQPTDL